MRWKWRDVFCMNILPCVCNYHVSLCPCRNQGGAGGTHWWSLGWVFVLQTTVMVIYSTLGVELALARWVLYHLSHTSSPQEGFLSRKQVPQLFCSWETLVLRKGWLAPKTVFSAVLWIWCLLKTQPTASHIRKKKGELPSQHNPWMCPWYFPSPASFNHLLLAEVL
jgi:hypothetical protein